MRTKYKKILKIFCEIIATFIIVACVLFAMFFFDSGRQVLLDGFTAYAQKKGINCDLYGLDRTFSKIDTARLGLDDGSLLLLSDILVKGNGIFEKFDIKINELTFKPSGEKKGDSNFSFPISSIKTLGTFVKRLRIENAIFDFSGKKYYASADVQVMDDHVCVKVCPKLGSIIEKLPTAIKKNFENTKVQLEIKYPFDKNLKNKIAIYVERNGNSVGQIYGVLRDNFVSIKGDLSWIDIYNYQLEKFDCEIRDFKTIKATIKGREFDIALAAKIGDGFLIENLVLDAKKSGYIKAIKPFLIKENTDVAFAFKFDQLDFLNEIVKLSGDTSGTVEYKNGIIKADFRGNKLAFKHKGVELLGYSASINDKDISLVSKHVRCPASEWQNLSFGVANNILVLKGRINNDAFLIVHGKVSDRFKKLSLDKCSLVSNEMSCETKVCNLNFEESDYNIICEIQNKKTGKTGQIKLRSDSTKTKLELNSFRPNTFNKIFDIWIPKCKLDGSINLKHSDKATSGTGNITVSELLSARSSVDLNGNLFDNTLHLNALVKSAKNILRCEAQIPFCFSKERIDSQHLRSVPLKCRVFGTACLEHLFELPDKTDARGTANFDLRVSGTFANPQINGVASLKDGYFVIKDVFLRRGNIQFNCSGDSIKVVHAEFIDNQRKKMIVTGSGKFFFDGLIPNIKTNLTLACDNFRLFDSEDLSITVKGNGKITGAIDDLLISGNVDITKCTVRNMGTDLSDHNDGIVIDNEINVPKKALYDSDNERDFCRYDVAMHCPKVLVVGDIYEMEFGGDLHLASYNHRVTLIGSLELKKGKLDLFSKRMIIRKGSADFLEQYPFDPKLNLLCESNLGDMIAYLKIKSTPAKGGSFRLYSSPSYSQETILSHMLFGKDLKYLSVSEAAQFAQAMSSFRQSGGYIFSILNTFKNSGVIDTISFTNSSKGNNSLNTNTQTSETQGNINVSAGKYIGDNLFISINKNSDETTSFDIDYALTPKLSVKANTNGEAGISWKYKY